MAAWAPRPAALVGSIANWRYFKVAVFIACALPIALLSVDFSRYVFLGQESALGVDPVKTLEHETGEDALMFLLFTLTITPLRRFSGVNRVQSVRRMLGVWSFAYALVHVTIYLALDRSCFSLATCEYREIWTDVLKRKFIFAGLTAFTILLALAITSTSGWVRRLRRNWARLHRLVYVAAAAAIVHFVWIQKSDIREPLWWAGYLALLFGARLYFAWRKRHSKGTEVAVAKHPPSPLSSI